MRDLVNKYVKLTEARRAVKAEMVELMLAEQIEEAQVDERVVKLWSRDDNPFVSIEDAP